MYTKFQSENLKGRDHLETRLRWEDNIQIYPKEILCEDVFWIQLAKDRVQ